MKNIFSYLLDLIFPPFCLICGEKDELRFCEDCQSKIKYINFPYCVHCGFPLSEYNVVIPLCSECKNKPKRFSFTSARAVCVYEGVLKKAIDNFKYRKKRILSKYLGEILVNYLERLDEKKNFPKNLNIDLSLYCFPKISSIDYIIPVPLHMKKEKERNFNQAKLLGEIISEKLKIPIIENCLKRTRYTLSQTSIKGKDARDERKRNIEGAFKINNSDFIKRKIILLIDDVFTTGATSNECAKELKKNGASKIFVLTLARA